MATTLTTLSIFQPNPSESISIQFIPRILGPPRLEFNCGMKEARSQTRLVTGRNDGANMGERPQGWHPHLQNCPFNVV